MQIAGGLDVTVAVAFQEQYAGDAHDVGGRPLLGFADPRHGVPFYRIDAAGIPSGNADERDIPAIIRPRR